MDWEPHVEKFVSGKRSKDCFHRFRRAISHCQRRRAENCPYYALELLDLARCVHPRLPEFSLVQSVVDRTTTKKSVPPRPRRLQDDPILAFDEH